MIKVYSTLFFILFYSNIFKFTQKKSDTIYYQGKRKPALLESNRSRNSLVRLRRMIAEGTKMTSSLFSSYAIILSIRPCLKKLIWKFPFRVSFRSNLEWSSMNHKPDSWNQHKIRKVFKHPLILECFVDNPKEFSCQRNNRFSRSPLKFLAFIKSFQVGTVTNRNQ